MSHRGNLPPRHEGHLSFNNGNRDLDQKLTYQQLLNLNHDLTKENQQLKTIGNRLGEELKNLHTQFQIRPREEENSNIYHAIGTHPALHNYELTLTPLLDTYEAKIQEFEHNFETIYEEFILLEKKFEEVCSENEGLKMQLTDRTKELMELYQSNSSDKLLSAGGDFGQLILQQVGEKQKNLIEENSKLEADYHKFKSEAERNRKELIEVKQNYESTKKKLRDLELESKKQEGDLRSFKDNCFDFQVKNNELEVEKTKLEQALERAQSQINQLTKEKEFYLKKHEEHRKSIESNVNFGSSYGSEDQSKLIEDLRTKITFLEAEQVPSDHFKKFGKLQKEFESVQKENLKLKESIEASQTKENELHELTTQLKNKISKLEQEKLEVDLSESKLKKSVEQLNSKLKGEVEKVRTEEQSDRKRLQEDLMTKIQKKEKKIHQIEDALEKIKLEKDKLEKENVLNSGKDSSSKVRGAQKDSEKMVEKMREKMSINEELFREQIQITENENSHLKKQTESYRTEAKEKSEEARRLRQELESTKKQLHEITQKKAILIEEIRRVRNEYEGNLKDKERMFDEKIKQVKLVVEESDRKRKSEREKVQEVSKQYKNVLEQMKSTYEERIRTLENESFGRNQSDLNSKKQSNLMGPIFG